MSLKFLEGRNRKSSGKGLGEGRQINYYFLAVELKLINENVKLETTLCNQAIIFNTLRSDLIEKNLVGEHDVRHDIFHMLEKLVPTKLLEVGTKVDKSDFTFTKSNDQS